MPRKKLFESCQLGPLTLRNRSIRSAAFENMCVDNRPTDQLFDFHESIAKGGIGMTTLAYAAICPSGLSFDGQLLMRNEIRDDLRTIRNAIHAHGALASIQIGHCGNMAHMLVAGMVPVGPSNGFNLYAPSIVRGLRVHEIEHMVFQFGKAAQVAKEAGFDCVEVHAGHGYLIGQFLSPYFNKRTDQFGGSLHNRMRFMRLCIEEVQRAAGKDMAVVVKMNMYDGFKKGLQQEDCLTIGKELEKLEVDGIILSAGTVNKTPMQIMHGAMPIKTMGHYMNPINKLFVRPIMSLLGKKLIPEVPFKENYFLEEAKVFRKALNLPLIYVGGIKSKKNIDEVLEAGFDFVQIARALVNDPEFINKIKADEDHQSPCKNSNYCVARMYSTPVKCHQCVENLPKRIKKEIEKLEKRNGY